MKILALDCATQTGWAVTDNATIIESGSQSFAKRRGESNGIMFLKFRKWLETLISLWKPEVVAYERAHFRGGAATEICVGLQTRVQEIAADNGIELLPVATGELKKFATGKGNAGKHEIMKAAEVHLQRPPIDDNEADAVFLALFASREVER